MLTAAVQHSPIGAFASFTLGHPGASGGLGLGLAGPARQQVVVAVQDQGDLNRFVALPFFAAAESDGSARFLVTREADDRGEDARHLRVEAATDVRREIDAVSDRWTSEAFTFTVHSPLGRVPDPADRGNDDVLRELSRPAVLAELEVDNRTGTAPRRALIGYSGTDVVRPMRHIRRDGLIGVGEGGRTAMVTDAEGARSAVGFDIGFILTNADEHDPAAENWAFGLGDLGLIVVDVPPGERRVLRVAMCFHEAGPVTTGVVSRYLYTRWYADIEQVAAAALARFDASVSDWRAAADELGFARLPADRALMLAHAVRSYYGNSQLLLDADDAPLWVVNEGEYRMINTLDLTVDHAFFEARMHPWTLRDTLARFRDRHAYRDRFGLSFTHDMGVAGAFAEPGRSAYERTGRTDCFSFMTGEQLVNWVLTAGVLAASGPEGAAWCEAQLPVLADCLDSMIARDPERRGGVGLDSDRVGVGVGAEITTYDSLDESLGRARGSMYLIVKYLIAYRWLARQLSADGERAALAQDMAGRCAATVLANVRPDGTVAALAGDTGSAFTIPVIEGFAYAAALGDDLADAGHLLDGLRTHLTAVLRPGRCLFPDGGWRLTSSSENSWLSKTYLAQFVARRVLGLPDDDAMARADGAHLGWLQHPEGAEWAWSDQIVAGVPRGSRYYPRGVTAILWLDEPAAAAGAHREAAVSLAQVTMAAPTLESAQP